MRNERFSLALDAFDQAIRDVRVERRSLLAHSLEQLRAGDAAREARVIMRARNHRRTAVAGVDQPGREEKARQIDGGGKPCRPRANDQAIDRVTLAHRRVSARWIASFRLHGAAQINREGE